MFCGIKSQFAFIFVSFVACKKFSWFFLHCNKKFLCKAWKFSVSKRFYARLKEKKEKSILSYILVNLILCMLMNANCLLFSLRSIGNERRRRFICVHKFIEAKSIMRQTKERTSAKRKFITICSVLNSRLDTKFVRICKMSRRFSEMCASSTWMHYSFFAFLPTLYFSFLPSAYIKVFHFIISQRAFSFSPKDLRTLTRVRILFSEAWYKMK